MTQPMLFTPIKLRDLTLKNRIVVSPMCQYSAENGFVTDWHFVHLGKFAQGGAGAVFVEASAVEPHGRITYGDAGIWSDAHVAPLKRIAIFVKSQGAAPAMQLAHAGRKASMQRPWHGNGPLNDSDQKRGETPWPIVAPSAIPMDEGWLTPSALSINAMIAMSPPRRATVSTTIASPAVLSARIDISPWYGRARHAPSTP